MSKLFQRHQLPEWHDPVDMIGNQEILQSKKLALFCSRRCPGKLILKACDLAHSLREAGVTVVDGFHSCCPGSPESFATALIVGNTPCIYNDFSGCFLTIFRLGGSLPGYLEILVGAVKRS